VETIMALEAAGSGKSLFTRPFGPTAPTTPRRKSPWGMASA